MMKNDTLALLSKSNLTKPMAEKEISYHQEEANLVCK